MLISLAHRFIFVANLKTASTSIERTLAPHAQICLDRSEWDKHISLCDIETRYGRIFEMMPRSEFRVITVLRQPLDRMLSFYKSGKSVRFEGTALNTNGMTFEEFLVKWRTLHAAQIGPQADRLLDFKNRFGADFVMRFDRLQQDFAYVCQTLGLPACELPMDNASVDTGTEGQISAHIACAVENEYGVDHRILDNFSGRWLTEEERRDASMALRFKSLQTEKNSFEYLIENTETEEKSLHRFITPDDVVWAFRMLLGRDPESDDVIENHCALGSRALLREHIMASAEFNQNIVKLKT